MAASGLAARAYCVRENEAKAAKVGKELAVDTATNLIRAQPVIRPKLHPWRPLILFSEPTPRLEPDACGRSDQPCHTRSGLPPRVPRLWPAKCQEGHLFTCTFVFGRPSLFSPPALPVLLTPKDALPVDARLSPQLQRLLPPRHCLFRPTL